MFWRSNEASLIRVHSGCFCQALLLEIFEEVITHASVKKIFLQAVLRVKLKDLIKIKELFDFNL
jgi:hypothetical protein